MTDVSELNNRWRENIKPALKDELPHTYEQYIDPLEIIAWDAEKKIVLLRNKSADNDTVLWTKKHFAAKIKEAMGRDDLEVMITNRRDG